MPKPNNSSNDLLRYAGLGAQIMVSIGLAVFAGLKLDQWLHLPFPLLVWLLPLVVVSVMIYKLIKDTSKKT
ncbi:MAG TPA: AtpZ/AtpI family protein [Flavisolibacter sp.]|nr:AtpZ/AtpI family protein [Flavisolibacter sp.]